MKRLAVVIARSGSKGVPGKNLRLLNGKPLISYILNSAIEAKININFDLVLSTDSEDIRGIGIELGAFCPFLRPLHLAQDDTPSWPVVQHAVTEMEAFMDCRYDTITYMQPTSPFCSPITIVDCNNMLDSDHTLKSVVAITEAEVHPFRLKRLVDDSRLINYIEQGFEDMRPRQILPKVFRRAGSVYVSRRSVVMEEDTLVAEPCGGLVVNATSAIDINSELDFILAESLIKSGLCIQ